MPVCVTPGLRECETQRVSIWIGQVWWVQVVAATMTTALRAISPSLMLRGVGRRPQASVGAEDTSGRAGYAAPFIVGACLQGSSGLARRLEVPNHQRLSRLEASTLHLHPRREPVRALPPPPPLSLSSFPSLYFGILTSLFLLLCRPRASPRRASLRLHRPRRRPSPEYPQVELL